MFVVLSHFPRLPRGDILYVLLTQKCETQLLFPIKAEGKRIRIIPAWTILPAFIPSDQALSWHYMEWNLRHYTNDHYGSVLRSYT